MKWKLRDCKEGSTVTIGGHKWQILRHSRNGSTFCIRKELLEDYKEFDKDHSNDWKKSSIREYLNNEYLKELMSEIKEEDGVSAILDTTQDLTTNDGLEDYESSTDKVVLLTCDQYRKYRHRFDSAADRWWLITADSTVNNSVCCINVNGTIDNCCADYKNLGIRPACTFNSYIYVDRVIRE